MIQASSPPAADKYVTPNRWVIPQPAKVLVIGVADMVVTNDPRSVMVTYSLGSCLGVLVYDPEKRVGGLLHVMLPDSCIDPGKGSRTPFMFLDTGLPRLFHAAYELGASRDRLIIKAAGGAQFLDPGGIFNIGERNRAALDRLLSRNGLRLVASDLGGVASRTLRLDLSTGRSTIHSPGTDPYEL